MARSGMAEGMRKRIYNTMNTVTRAEVVRWSVLWGAEADWRAVGAMCRKTIMILRSKMVRACDNALKRGGNSAVRMLVGCCGAPRHVPEGTC